MQRFHQRAGQRGPNGPFISEVTDARLYLSGYALLSIAFVFGASNGPEISSPILFGALVVIGFWGVLTVKYLPRATRSSVRKERDVFRHALQTVGKDPDKWGFLWYVSIAVIIGALAIYWIRFVI